MTQARRTPGDSRVTPSEIDLRIDELVLEGIAPADRKTLIDAVRRGLANALNRSDHQAAIASLDDRMYVDGGDITVGNRDAARLGEAIAAAVVSALRSDASRPNPRRST